MDTARKLHPLVATAVTAALAAGAAHATPPVSSPYATDVANVYVHDATSDGLAGLNMVLCVVKGLGAGDMLTAHGAVGGDNVTRVAYNALVDKARCDNASLASASNSASGATGASATPAYINAVVDVSRGAAASDPMVAAVWMTMASNGKPVTVWAKLSATQDPVSNPPYGTMHLDYAGYSVGTMQFNGFIDANGGIVTHVETSGGSGNGGDVALALNATSTSAGNGVIRSPDRSQPGSAMLTYLFQYTDAAFARNDGSGDVCFDRSRANAQSSVWSYGLYDVASGERVDLPHPGFPIVGTTAAGLTGISSGITEYGFAGYWGVNFGGVDPAVLGALPDGEVTAIANIQDSRSGHSASYRMYKDSGKLTRWTENTTTLGALDGIPMMFWAEGCSLVNGNMNMTAGAAPSPSGNSTCTGAIGPGNGPDFQNWAVQWSAAHARFDVVGVQSCSPGAGMCLVTNFTSRAGDPAPVPVVQDFRQQPINAWSEALGNVVIPIPPGDTMAAGGDVPHADSDPALYYAQSSVLPSAAAALDLYCLSNCPTAASLLDFASAGGSPFTSQTAMQWGAGASEVHYAFGANGLVDDAQGHVVLPSANLGGQQGVMTGRLYPTDLRSLTVNGVRSCPQGVGYCEPPAPTEYYTYQTGPNQWNQAIWLTAAGTPVAFDPPQNIAFTVPVGAAFGSWAGKAIQLQFSGFGNLNGIPGNCVDPNTNAVLASCTPASRFVAAFSLPDGTALTLGSRAVLTRALNAELRLAQMACPVDLTTAGLNLTPPATTPHDPSQSGDPSYIGTAPTVTSPPAVIDGVLQ
jgi:hypothetical protein